MHQNITPKLIITALIERIGGGIYWCKYNNNNFHGSRHRRKSKSQFHSPVISHALIYWLQVPDDIVHRRYHLGSLMLYHAPKAEKQRQCNKPKREDRFGSRAMFSFTATAENINAHLRAAIADNHSETLMCFKATTVHNTRTCWPFKFSLFFSKWTSIKSHTKALADGHTLSTA